jgi:hypothetical protein
MALSWFIVTKEGKEIFNQPNKFTIKEAIAEKPEKFVLFKQGSTTPIHILHLDDPRKKLIYVRRVDMTATRGYKVICHLVGWHMKVGGESIQSINYVFETIGRKSGEVVWIESAGKFKEDHGWFYSPTDKQLSEVMGIKA